MFVRINKAICLEVRLITLGLQRDLVFAVDNIESTF